MKAIQFSRFGRPEVVDHVDRRRPSPQKNEVLIEVTAAGVNFPDIRERQGVHQRAETHVAGHGVDVLLESIGGDIFERNFECLAMFGRYIIFGSTRGPGAPFATAVNDEMSDDDRYLCPDLFCAAGRTGARGASIPRRSHSRRHTSSQCLSRTSIESDGRSPIGCLRRGARREWSC